MDWQMLIGGMADEGQIVDAGFFLDWSIGMPWTHFSFGFEALFTLALVRVGYFVGL